MRQPAAFIPHGGGPWPLLDMGFDARERSALLTYLQALPDELPEPPRALLVVSAHWEAPVPTLLTTPRPALLFDYYGFPQAAYALTWPAPCASFLASRTRVLLKQAGFECAQDAERGYDHGVFMPLKVAYPQADIPVLQLSLVAGLDPKLHLEMGQAIAPLRDEGVHILGTGNSYHNLRAFNRPEGNRPSEAFDAWLRAAMQKPRDERAALLADWRKAPHAAEVHPREEHLLPLMVATGAALNDQARLTFDGAMMGKKLSGFHFG